jgi:hypothetical protein
VDVAECDQAAALFDDAERVALPPRGIADTDAIDD